MAEKMGEAPEATVAAEDLIEDSPSEAEMSPEEIEAATERVREQIRRDFLDISKEMAEIDVTHKEGIMIAGQLFTSEEVRWLLRERSIAHMESYSFWEGVIFRVGENVMDIINSFDETVGKPLQEKWNDLERWMYEFTGGMVGKRYRY